MVGKCYYGDVCMTERANNRAGGTHRASNRTGGTERELATGQVAL